MRYLHIFIVLLAIAGCSSPPPNPPKFADGSTVVSKVDKTRGVVISSKWSGNGYVYTVKFPTKYLLPNRYSKHICIEDELESR